MTKEEAYKKWIKEADQGMWGYDDLWNAACEWQKNQIDTYLYEVRFELPEDIRKKIFCHD